MRRTQADRMAVAELYQTINGGNIVTNDVFGKKEVDNAVVDAILYI